MIDELDTRHADKNKHWRLAYKGYSRSGVKLYFTPDSRLEGVSVEAIRGPQVFADGRPLVAQAPSVMERWVAFCIQRAGDQLITRPVFMSDPELADDIDHQLPGEAWDFF